MSLPYARIDVPVKFGDLGTGSYLRLGGYTAEPDQDIIATFSEVIVQQSTSTSTAVDDLWAVARAKKSTTNAKMDIAISSTAVTPDEDGVILKTDKTMYVSVENAQLNRVGYLSTDVIKGDCLFDVKQGAFFAGGEQGVSIVAGSTSSPANIVLEAHGYIKQTAHGPTDEWTYGDKTSRVKGTQKDYTEGEKWSYIDGYQFSENKGTKDAWVYGSSNSVLFGLENTLKASGKAELIIGASIALNVGLALKLVLGGDYKIVFPMDFKMVGGLDMKIIISDLKIANSDFKIVNFDGKLPLTKATITNLDTKTKAIGATLGATTAVNVYTAVHNGLFDLKNKVANVFS